MPACWLVRESAERLSRVAVGVFTEVRAGRTEREVARAIDGRLIEAGFERPAFEFGVIHGEGEVGVGSHGSFFGERHSIVGPRAVDHGG